MPDEREIEELMSRKGGLSNGNAKKFSHGSGSLSEQKRME